MDKKIFIVEDNIIISSTLQSKLSVEGFKVETDPGNISITETIGKIKRFKPDFVILDIILPKIDGFDVTKKLKSDEETKKIPIFVFTSLSDSDSRARGLDLGADYFFLKDDFIIDDFVEKVKKTIANLDKIKK